MDELEITSFTSDELYTDLHTFAFKIDEPKKGSYYRVRQTDPSKYKEFRIIDIDAKKGVRAVLGIFEEGGKRKSEVQSFLFDKDSWEKKDIQKWIKENVDKKSKKSKASVMESTTIDIDFEITDEARGNTSAIDRVIAAEKLTRNKDLMYIVAKYVHEGENLNKDVFLYDEIKEKYTTAILKPINWEHTDSKIIGTIYDSEFVDRDESEDGKAYIRIYGVIYKKLFPEVASVIQNRYKDGDLKVSMETWFDKAKCSQCGGVFSSSDEYCTHLQNRFFEPNNKRILLNLTFGGVGIVKKPADVNADVLAIASNLSLKEKVQKSQEVTKFDTILSEARNIFFDIVYAYYDNKEEGVKERKSKLNTLISELVDLIGTININKIAKGEIQVEDKVKYPEDVVEALIEKAKADKNEEFEKQLNDELDKVNKEWNDRVEALNKELNTIKEAKEKAEAEFAEYKKTVEQEKTLAERKRILAENKIEFEDMDEKDIDSAILEMSTASFELFVKAKKAETTDNTKDTKKTKEDAATASVVINDNDVEDDDKTPSIKDILKKL